MDEIWRAVKDFEGSYEVSSLGQVRSLDRQVPSCRGRTRAAPGRVLSPTRTKGGYAQVSLRGSGRRRTAHVHSLVLEAFVGPRPRPGMEACHGDGDSSNDRLSNLRWDTNSANHYDAVRHRSHFQSSKTCCPRGHLLAHPNLVESKLPRRECRSCSRATKVVHNAWARKRIRLDMTPLANEFYREVMPTP